MSFMTASEVLAQTGDYGSSGSDEQSAMPQEGQGDSGAVAPTDSAAPAPATQANRPMLTPEGELKGAFGECYEACVTKACPAVRSAGNVLALGPLTSCGLCIYDRNGTAAAVKLDFTQQCGVCKDACGKPEMQKATKDCGNCVTDHCIDDPCKGPRK